MRIGSWKCAALVGLFCLSGCTAVGPNYEQPVIANSPQFVGGGSAALVEAAQIAWWKALNDPLLDELVSKGIAQNLDIIASLQRIEQARAQLRQRGVNSQLSGGISAQSIRSDSGLTTQQKNSVSADASFVFDLFGGVRRGVEQSQAALGQAQFDAATVRLGYLAELVSAFVQVRYFQNASEISRQTLASQKETVSLVQFRVEEGDATQLELQQALQLVDRTNADLPLLRANFEGNVFRMAALLAEPAGPLLKVLQQGAALPSPRGLGKTGIPADLVRNRPDIRSAERAIAAATAGIGIAEAQLYPSLAINGSIAASTQNTWKFGPSISLPVLNRGVLTAKRDEAFFQAQQAETAWRNTVTLATEDVQTSLSLTRGLNTQISALRRVNMSARRLVSLTRDSYQGGGSPITEVLDAEQALSSARLSLLGARRDFALSWVELQISTGKGWSSQ